MSHRTLFRSLSALALTLLAACSSESTDNETAGIEEGSGPTYYADIKPIIDAHCVACHVEGGSGPFPLVTAEQVKARAGSIAAATAARTMPPFPAAPAVRPYLYDISLSDAQIASISAWAAAGAPVGTPASEGSALDVDFGLLDNPNLTLTMAAAFTPTERPDHYRCFTLPWPYSEDKFITGFNVRAGNKPLVHHAVLYLVDAPQAGIVDAAEGSDGKPGYSCYGSAAPADVTEFATRQVGGWAPGSEGTNYAAGTGVRVSAGARVVLQMHYNLVGVDSAAPDLSSVEFRVEDSVTFEGGMMPWLDLNWPSTEGSMSIAAGAPSTIYSYLDDPTTAGLAPAFIPGVDVSQGLRIFSIYPHMHQLGRTIAASVVRANGDVVPLVAINDWDFHWQRDYTLAQPVEVYPGDQLKVECDFDNSPANQGIINGTRQEPRTLDFGEGSFDEMCVAAFYVTQIAETIAASPCEEAGSVEAAEGTLAITFDAAPTVRNNGALEGELTGNVYGAIYRTEDVTITGPRPGAVSVGSFAFDAVDLRNGATDGPRDLGLSLPAGDYQFLGFMDTDGNADPAAADPDPLDPVLIPGRAVKVACAAQQTTLRFSLLLPN